MTAGLTGLTGHAGLVGRSGLVARLTATGSLTATAWLPTRSIAATRAALIVRTALTRTVSLRVAGRAIVPLPPAGPTLVEHPAVMATLTFDPVIDPFEPIVSTVDADQAHDADHCQHTRSDKCHDRSTTCSLTTYCIHASEVTRRR